jgi:hypothetical protein
MSRIDDIRKRYNDNGLTENQYKAIKTHQIAQMRVDIKHLLYELDCVTKERDAAIGFAGKLVALCEIPKEWRDKVLRRHVNRPGDYMGSGYDFLDAFYKLFEDFTETAGDTTYQAVRLAIEQEIAKRWTQEGEWIWEQAHTGGK